MVVPKTGQAMTLPFAVMDNSNMSKRIASHFPAPDSLALRYEIIAKDIGFLWVNAKQKYCRRNKACDDLFEQKLP